MSIFSNSSHFEWKAGLSDTILKGDHPSQIFFKLVQRFQRRFKCDLLSKYKYNIPRKTKMLWHIQENTI
jgi:hypothetical protein